MTTKQTSKKQTYGPISQTAFALRINPDGLKAVEDYQAYMLRDHNQLVSMNKAINALLINGWQYIKDAKADGERMTT